MYTALGQACISISLRPDNCDEESGNGVRNNSLVRYAENWVVLAQFEHASSYLRNSTESLFDLDKAIFLGLAQIVRH